MMRIVVLALLMAIGNQAQGSEYECMVKGQTKYSDMPCPDATQAGDRTGSKSQAVKMQSVYRCPLYEKQHKYGTEKCSDSSVAPIEFQVVDPVRQMNENAVRLRDDLDSRIRFMASDDGCKLTHSVKLPYMTSETVIPLAQVNLIYIEGFHDHNPGSLMVTCRNDKKCIDSDETSNGSRYRSKLGHYHLVGMAESDAWTNNVGASLMLNISQCSER